MSKIIMPKRILKQSKAVPLLLDKKGQAFSLTDYLIQIVFLVQVKAIFSEL
jgi:hypothetical protein